MVFYVLRLLCYGLKAFIRVGGGGAGETSNGSKMAYTGHLRVPYTDVGYKWPQYSDAL